MRYLLIILSITIFLCSCAQVQNDSSLTPIGRQTRNGNILGYFEYLPYNYNDKNDWPVLIVLHGFGRQGNGDKSSLRKKLGTWGIVNWVQSNDVPFVILIPQDPSSNFTGSPTRLELFYDWAREEYRNKTNKNKWSVSYNSFSGGAFSEWCKENTHNFQSVSAHILSASLLPSKSTIEQYKNVINSGSSIWFHHSFSDDTISYGPTRDFYRGIMKIAGSQNHSKYRYTLYQNIGHSTFNSVVYNDKGNKVPQEIGDMGEGGFDYYHWSSGSFWDWLKSQGNRN